MYRGREGITATARQTIMNKVIKTALVISSAVLLAGTASAGEIYKYVDENGNVTYGDRPTGSPAEQRMNVVTRATNPAEVQASVDATLELEERLEKSREARQEKKAAAEEKRKAAEQRQAKCSENRVRLEKYNESRRLYREDANGERVYLDDKERQKAMQHTRELISEFCS